MNKYGAKCETSLRFWENNGWINKIDPYGWFQWYFRYWLGSRSKDDERQINRRKKIASSSTGKLVKLIRDIRKNVFSCLFNIHNTIGLHVMSKYVYVSYV